MNVYNDTVTIVEWIDCLVPSTAWITSCEDGVMDLPYAIPSRPVVTRELANSVQYAYGIDLKDARDLGGSYNLNLGVIAHGHPAVVRVYRPWMSPERLSAIQEIRAELASGGVPGSRRHSTIDGQGHYASEVGLIEVEDFVRSDGYMESWLNISKSIELLAVMHNRIGACRSRIPKALAQAPVSNVLPVGPTAGRWTRAATSAILAWDTTATDRHFVRLADSLAIQLDEIAVPADLLESHLTHGDYWGRNVLFMSGEPVLVADFDFIAVRPRIFDIAVLLYSCIEHFGRNRVHEDLPRYQKLVDSYDARLSSPLSLAERRELPLAIARVPLGLLSHIAILRHYAMEEFRRVRGPACEWFARHVRLHSWQAAFL